MSNKFYKTKKFIDQQNKWYKKLKDEGFEDIEWYNPATGIGHGSSFLRSKNIPDSGELRSRYCPQLQQHYRLCRNFLCHGDFYPILAEKYSNSEELQRIFGALQDFLEYYGDSREIYSPAEYEVWKLYTNGSSIRAISSHLRHLHKTKKLPKYYRESKIHKRCLPYSIFWVKTKLDKLKIAMLKFNMLDSEGILRIEAEKELDSFDNQDLSAIAGKAGEDLKSSDNAAKGGSISKNRKRS